MPQDHFIAQTYLRAFTDPDTARGPNDSGRLHAYSKKDLKYFTPSPASICKTINWDDNPKYLSIPDALGKWLSTFEPYWGAAVQRVEENHHLSNEDKFLIAGYWAYLSTCTPAWQRFVVELQEADLQEKHLPAAIEYMKAHPEEYPLAEKYAPLVEAGSVKVWVDKDYSKAILTTQLSAFQWFLYHQEWDIVRNDTDERFLTSDNPSCFDYSSALYPARYLPLTPKLALWTSADQVNLPSMTRSLQRPIRKSNGRTALKKFVQEKNVLIIKCAEMLVLSSAPKAYITNCVAKYQSWRLCRDVALRVSVPGGYCEVVQARPNTMKGK